MLWLLVRRDELQSCCLEDVHGPAEGNVPMQRQIHNAMERHFNVVVWRRARRRRRHARSSQQQQRRCSRKDWPIHAESLEDQSLLTNAALQTQLITSGSEQVGVRAGTSAAPRSTHQGDAAPITSCRFRDAAIVKALARSCLTARTCRRVKATLSTLCPTTREFKAHFALDETYMQTITFSTCIAKARQELVRAAVRCASQNVPPNGLPR